MPGDVYPGGTYPSARAEVGPFTFVQMNFRSVQSPTGRFQRGVFWRTIREVTATGARIIRSTAAGNSRVE